MVEFAKVVLMLSLITYAACLCIWVGRQAQQLHDESDGGDP